MTRETSMQAKRGRIFRFDPFVLDESDRRLLKDGQPVAIEPKVFETLIVLLENGGRLVSKDEILSRVWPDSFVEEASLPRNIHELRKALGDNPSNPRYIETVPKRGYRFRAEVIEVTDKDAPLVVEKWTSAEIVTEEVEEITGASDLSAEIPLHDKAIQVPPVSQRNLISSFRRRRLAVVSIVVFGLIGLLVYWQAASSPELPATGAEVKSMAVLPFTTLGAKSEDKYLGLGLADVLITQLGRMRQIVIRPIGAVQKHAETEQPDPLAVGRELGVEAVLEGSVQHAGDNLRVTVRLLRVGDGVVLWSGKFDEKFTDIFSLQDSLSQQVAEALTLNMSREERELLTKRYTNNVEAYQLYLKGRYFWNRRTTEGLRRSLEYFNQAIEVDPTYALAYAGLADAYALLVWQHELPPSEYIPRAKAAATRALEMDEMLGEAHTSLGFVKFWYEWDFPGAESEYRRGVELKPDYATAHHWYGEFLVLMGRTEEGFKELRMAQEADPLSLRINSDIGGMLFFARQQDQAIEQLKKALEMDPHFPLVKMLLAMAYNQKGMAEEAIAELREEANKPDTLPILKALLGYSYAKAGRTAEAVTILNGLKDTPPKRFIPSFGIALVYVGLGQNEQALEWLEKARTERDPFMVYIKMDPNFDTLRGDPRFADLVRRVGFAA
jgi:DNA-binding winged helix-turn-helix (wHTH) protein/TolB-like protein